MKTWRVYTPYICRVVIEEDADEWSRMKQFDGLSEDEILDVVRTNILKKWPEAVLSETTHWNRPAIDVSKDGTFHYIEPETPPGLYYAARGY